MTDLKLGKAPLTRPCLCGCGKPAAVRRWYSSRLKLQPGTATYLRNHEKRQSELGWKERVCRVCKVTKPRLQFAKDKNRWDGMSVDCKACMAARTRSYHLRTRNDCRLRRIYGISAEQRDEMFQRQNGLCAICGCDDRRLVVDHDHETGRVRGLLCDSCNVGLARLGESSRNLHRAALYLDGTL